MTVFAMLVTGLLLVLKQAAFRPVEATASAAIIGTVHLAPAQTMGSFVLLPVRHIYIALDITTACTAALLISPFCLLAAGLVAIGRTSVRRGIATLAATALALFLVNQARVFVIALSLRAWGYPRGYEVSHILLGTVVSTLGIMGGLAIFVLSARHRPPMPAGAHG